MSKMIMSDENMNLILVWVNILIDNKELSDLGFRLRTCRNVSKTVACKPLFIS